MSSDGENIYILNSTVVIGCSGDVAVSNGHSQLGEMEEEIIKIFRDLSMSERVRFLQSAHSYMAHQKENPPGTDSGGKHKKTVCLQPGEDMNV